jgi:hypothetical protein
MVVRFSSIDSFDAAPIPSFRTEKETSLRVGRNVSRKPRPCLSRPDGMGGELHFRMIWLGSKGRLEAMIYKE